MKLTDSKDLLDVCLSGQAWSVFLDLDGALFDIALDPEAVAVPKRLVADLLEIKARLDGALAVVSGRTIEAVDKILDPASFDFAGTDGEHVRLDSTHYAFGALRKDLIEWAALKLRPLTQIHPGCLIVSDETGMAVHWRLAPHLEQIVLDHVLELASELGGDFRIRRDKCFVEIVPTGTGKAKALSFMMSSPIYRGRKPIFIGGAVSDEPTSRLIHALGGFSVHVGAEGSPAEYSLRDRSVARWLMNWAQAGKSRRESQRNHLCELQ